MSHSEETGRVDERAGHVLVVRHVDVVPGAVVDSRAAASAAGAAHLSLRLSAAVLLHSQPRLHGDSFKASFQSS